MREQATPKKEPFDGEADDSVMSEVFVVEDTLAAETEKHTQEDHENGDDLSWIQGIGSEKCHDSSEWNTNLKETRSLTIEHETTSPSEGMPIHDVLRFAAVQDLNHVDGDKHTPTLTPAQATSSNHSTEEQQETEALSASPSTNHTPSLFPGAYAVALVPCDAGGSRTIRVVRRRNEDANTDEVDLEEGEIDSHDDTESMNSECTTPPATIEDAVLVEPDPLPPQQPTPPEEVFEGKVFLHKPSRARNSMRGWFLVAGILVVGVIVLAISLIRTTKDTSKPSRATEKDNKIWNHPYTNDLSLEILNGIQEIGSSYYKANAWMLQDPYLDSYAPKRQKQRFQLAYFYFQSNGHNWTHNTHWLSYDQSECEWFLHNSSLRIGGWHKGMKAEPTCDGDSNLRVLNLTSNNLDGTSPVQASGISQHLLIFDVSNNHIQGPMPPVAGFAQDMEVFIVSNNQLEGQIVGGAGLQAFQQRIVKLDGNQLLGHIPEICMILPRLEVLDVSGNLFGQDLQYTHTCKNMTHLILRDNAFTGTIPTEIGLMSSLKQLDLSGNDLTGSLPSELGQLPSLKFLDISNSRIVGTIPESLCRSESEETIEITLNCSSVRCCN